MVNILRFAVRYAPVPTVAIEYTKGTGSSPNKKRQAAFAVPEILEDEYDRAAVLARLMAVDKLSGASEEQIARLLDKLRSKQQQQQQAHTGTNANARRGLTPRAAVAAAASAARKAAAEPAAPAPAADGPASPRWVGWGGRTLKAAASQGPSTRVPTPPRRPSDIGEGMYVLALHAFAARYRDELSLTPGDVLRLLPCDTTHSWWRGKRVARATDGDGDGGGGGGGGGADDDVGSKTGAGLFPANHVEVLEPEDGRARERSASGQERRRRRRQRLRGGGGGTGGGSARHSSVSVYYTAEDGEEQDGGIGGPK